MHSRHYWAIFVKFLVNNVFAGASASRNEIPDEIEDARLGTIIANAENCRYENASEVIEEVKIAAMKIGIKIVGNNEVDIDGEWEGVFEVCERQLRFCEEK